MKLCFLYRSSRLFKGIAFTALLIAIAFLIDSCKKNAADLTVSTVSADMVLTWNNAGTVAVTRMAPLTGSGPLPPMPESLIYAMINVAMHDALNTIRPMYERYALTDSIEKNASPAAAVAQAAHDVIVYLLPPQTAYADSLLQVSLSSIPDETSKTKGINLGKASAMAMMAKRQNDGASTVQYVVQQGTLPGKYRSTPPFDEAPFLGFMAVPGWGNITPFSLPSGDMYRPEAPYTINSPEYTKDYNEIKTLGSGNSTARTADQTQIAMFWLENVPLWYNRVARNMSMEQGMDAWKTARLFALLQMAEADANIAALNAKYYYFCWRPISAVTSGDSDGNADTQGDVTWQPLAPPTPPIPDYPSNHAVNGGAAAALIAAFFQKDQISFSATSSALPNVTRSYSSLSQSALECSLSRIYVGYHFRHAVIEGDNQGAKIGVYVYAHSLKPL